MCVCVCVCVTNFNIGNIADSIYSKFIRLGPKVAFGETFKMMWPWVTLKSHFLQFLTISRTLFTVQLWDVVKRYPEKRPSKWCDIGWLWHKNNCFSQRFSYPHFTWMLENVNFWPYLTISQTLFFGSKVMKVGLQVAYVETFKMMWHLVTFKVKVFT